MDPSGRERSQIKLQKMDLGQWGLKNTTVFKTNSLKYVIFVNLCRKASTCDTCFIVVSSLTSGLMFVCSSFVGCLGLECLYQKLHLWVMFPTQCQVQTDRTNQAKKLSVRQSSSLYGWICYWNIDFHPTRPFAPFCLIDSFYHAFVHKLFIRCMLPVCEEIQQIQ